VGVAVAAWLSADRERVVLGANIGAHQLELAAKVRERLKLPVVLE
jgi:predicted NBD/HSP70 family sugar kinase